MTGYYKIIARCLYAKPGQFRANCNYKLNQHLEDRKARSAHIYCKGVTPFRIFKLCIEERRVS